MKNDLIDVGELAKKLKVKRSWLYQRTRVGKIPHVKVGKYVRFDEAEIWKWLEKENEGHDDMPIL